MLKTRHVEFAFGNASNEDYVAISIPAGTSLDLPSGGKIVGPFNLVLRPNSAVEINSYLR